MGAFKKARVGCGKWGGWWDLLEMMRSVGSSNGGVRWKGNAVWGRREDSLGKSGGVSSMHE